MSSQQKRGFRLPWAAERDTEDGAAAATLEADPAESTAPAEIVDEVGGELGEGPFHFADTATPDASTDASPDAPEVPETTAEAAMIETETVTNATLETAPADGGGWGTAAQPMPADAATTSDQDATATDEAEMPAGHRVGAEPVAPGSMKMESDTRTTRSNPLVAGLVKAMREAALASREETTGRLKGDATAQTELIREAATAAAAELRKRADEDIAGIRDWSKAEIARIKSETDTRIESRKAELEEQTERHEASVERQVERVKNTVATYELEMDRFFEKLLAENDPAKVAALAEQAPEPPDLAADDGAADEPVGNAAGVAQAVPVVDVDANGDDSETAGRAWDDVAWGVNPARLAEIADPNPEMIPSAEAPTTADEAVAGTDEAEGDSMLAPAASTDVDTETTTADTATVEPVEGLEAEAAAEAEAASTEGLEIPADDVWPTSVLAAARRSLHTQANEFEAAGVANTRLFVNGLTSVAGISAFKGALGQLPGVRSVSVSSGQPGIFIFTVVHSPDTDLQDGVAGLTEFEARVTEATGGELTVAAQEPAA